MKFGLFAVGGEMRAGQDDGARVRVARAKIVEKFLAQIGNGLHIEDEEIRPGVEDEVLGLAESRRHIDLRGRSSFVKRGPNVFGERQVRFEHQDAPARRGVINGMARRRFVHDENRGGPAAVWVRAPGPK